MCLAEPDGRSRAVAAGVLRDLIAGHSLSATLGVALVGLPAAERPLAQELCLGVARWYPRLDLMLGALLARPLRARDSDLRALLLLGLYQLLYMRLPAHAAVAETVEASRQLGKPWAAGLINGVLRSLLRDREAYCARADARPEGQYAQPAWLLERLRRAWPERWQLIAEACNQRPPMTLRVNRLRISREDYQAELARAGIYARLLSASGAALELSEPLPVQRVPGFAAGLASVQDAGAQLAAGLLDLGPGQRVLDACAAPGGKACHILESEPALQALVAVDIDQARLGRVRENVQRLGLTAQLHVGDAVRPSGVWAQSRYDRVLLDVPCSATGVMRRHPDIKLLRRNADIAELAKGQARMLGAVWPLLERGGMLLYATCSLMPEENERQAEQFLRATADARERPIRAAWGQARTVGRQTLPGEDGMDGFYYACVEKV